MVTRAKWIPPYQRLSDADFVVAILTPNSMGRPWILWECGAASGVNKERGIVPVVHKMSLGDLTGPLSSYQGYAGGDPVKVQEVCERFARKAELQPRPEFWQPFLEEYMQAVESFAPPTRYSDRVFALWTRRFEELTKAGRHHELPHLVDQFYLAIGGKRPVDIMIHELLSKVFLDSGRYERALEEADFALSLLPDDTPLLHRKGLQWRFNCKFETYKLSYLDEVLKYSLFPFSISCARK